MKKHYSIVLTAADAAILSCADAAGHALAARVRREAQALATHHGATVEIIHPSGYVWDWMFAAEAE